MKLKQIKIDGFKSFADKVQIDVKDGITAIVGPNGSGKSNVLDAVKWVLGEQSIKTLRATGAMSDVIFQGSNSRKPMTRASVSLVFDNTDHYLNSDFKEIEIKRCVYASDDNEYYINSSKVRLKDITNLFLDSGAGKEAMNIISQGKIGEVLNSKPEERRSIIESSAGVLKYKKRKQESLKKLDKTSDNLLKIDLIIRELEDNLIPLKSQKEKAIEYQSYKKRLEDIELALLVKDIKTLSQDKETFKEEVKSLKEEEEKLKLSLSKNDLKQESLKIELDTIEQKINEINSELLKKTEEISSLDAAKQIISERKKYKVDNLKLEDNIIVLKEKIHKLSIEQSLLKANFDSETSKKEKIESEIDKLKTEYKYENANLKKLTNEQSLKSRLNASLVNKLDIAMENVESNALLPYAVKQILNSLSLKGICGTLSSLIEIDAEFTNAIDTALSYAQNTIVCNETNDAKKAINYLKENRLGRATFFPIDVIKPRIIDEKIYDKLKKDAGFIDIASNLVNTEKKYENIVSNQLGCVIVVRDLDSINRIGKLIDYKYKVVSLDGDILYAGGSISGGAKKEVKNVLSETAKIESMKKTIKNNNDNLNELTKKINELNEKLTNLDTKVQEKIFEHSRINLSLATKKDQLKDLEKTLSDLNDELGSIDSRKTNSLDNELNNAMDNYYSAIENKKILEEELFSLKGEKDSLSLKINELLLQTKKETTSYNNKISVINKNNIELEKIDLKLDNLIMRLTDDYDITYEKALKEIGDKQVTEKEREEVSILRRKIKDLGEVNIGAISEFNRINDRFQFLDKERNDLKEAMEDLTNVIEEMDEEMKKRFKDTFDKVNIEFERVFKKLFKGGQGKLILTNPEDYLTTGIDIIAQPPGKKLKNINLLSGGEKTLTAISLLFAILNVRPAPFCILDEVEAALDEVNVGAFGSYLKEHEDKTQFIIITHKKKTMEYAANLYGLTMQESGVSKLVSVKLDNKKRTTK